MTENNVIKVDGNENIISDPAQMPHHHEEDEISLDAPADFTSPDVLYAQLVDTIKKYHPSTDMSQIEKAYKIATKAHEGQFRKSGEPYIIHPICVAIILAELELDKESIIAGLLHDVVEDTVMTTDDITREFGAEVALLVDGVTKLTQLNYEHDKIEIQAENLRKMFLAMAKDIRVIMIKLADRLHNMRTMQYQSPAKQIEKSRETMEIYAPIAHRLGISKVKVELDDLSLKYLQPGIYDELPREEAPLHGRGIRPVHRVELPAAAGLDQGGSEIRGQIDSHRRRLPLPDLHLRVERHLAHDEYLHGQFGGRLGPARLFRRLHLG